MRVEVMLDTGLRMVVEGNVFRIIGPSGKAFKVKPKAAETLLDAVGDLFYALEKLNADSFEDTSVDH